MCPKNPILNKFRVNLSSVPIKFHVVHAGRLVDQNTLACPASFSPLSSKSW